LSVRTYYETDSYIVCGVHQGVHRSRVHVQAVHTIQKRALRHLHEARVYGDIT
jgi:hypothetical protein